MNFRPVAAEGPASDSVFIDKVVFFFFSGKLIPYIKVYDLYVFLKECAIPLTL